MGGVPGSAGDPVMHAMPSARKRRSRTGVAVNEEDRPGKDFRVPPGKPLTGKREK
jgi:hypothetical protein